MLRLFRREQKASPTPVLRREGRSQRWAAVVPQADRRVRVVAITRETADAVSVALEPCDAGRFIHQPGQYLTHCLEIDGRPLRRAYSISGAKGERRLTCTIKRMGRVSGYINDRLQVGDEYSIRGPSGDFTLDGVPAGPLVMVAGGSGITPVVHLIETALAAEPDRSITLVHANRRAEDVIFGRRLAALADAHAGFRIIDVLSQPAPGWQGEVGHVDAARLRAWTPAEATYFLCGPAGLMDAVAAGLEDLPPGRLQREDFISVQRTGGDRPKAPQTLHFARSGQAVTQQIRQTILEAGLAAGLPLDFSCTVGGCAACKVRVSRGDVVHDEPHCLSDAERNEGWVLACSAYASGPVEIEA